MDYIIGHICLTYYSHITTIHLPPDRQALYTLYFDFSTKAFVFCKGYSPEPELHNIIHVDYKLTMMISYLTRNNYVEVDEKGVCVSLVKN